MIATVTHDDLIHSDPTKIAETLDLLYDNQNSLDHFFEDYLKDLDLDQCDEREWWVYREMLKEHDRIDDLIKAARFRIGL